VPGLRLYLLGAPRLERDGVALAFDSRKQLALIAYLAMTGQSHTREGLITLLWPELDSSRGRAGLRRDLSVIRRALEGQWPVVEGETIGSGRRLSCRSGSPIGTGARCGCSPLAGCPDAESWPRRLRR
jgi:DNA-binding SARP family transcriptional activator